MDTKVAESLIHGQLLTLTWHLGRFMATDKAITGTGKTYMAIPDEAGRTHLVELDQVRRTAAALEREGVDIAGLRVDRAATSS